MPSLYFGEEVVGRYENIVRRGSVYVKARDFMALWARVHKNLKVAEPLWMKIKFHDNRLTHLTYDKMPCAQKPFPAIHDRALTIKTALTNIASFDLKCLFVHEHKFISKLK